MKLLLFVFVHIFLCLEMKAQDINPSDSSKNKTVISECDTPPQIKYRPEIDYPPMAQSAMIETQINVEVFIDENGIPKKCKIIKRVPQYAFMFDEAVLKSIMKWEFYPCLDKKNQAVKSRIIVPFRFRFENFEPSVCLKQIKPILPSEAKEMGLESWVALAVLVDELGMPVRNKTVVVTREYQHIKIFDESAKEVALNSEYKPASYDGKNVSSWLFLKVEFKIDDE